MEKILVKLLNRTPLKERRNEKAVVRKARHRYERPSALQAEMNMKQIRAQAIESQKVMYTRVLSDMLQLHNYYRARHSASPLAVSQRLNRIAQKYADHLAATGKFEHSGNKFENEIIGENLYMQWISHGRVPVSAREAAKSWYDEIEYYNFNYPQYSEETGHFTQLVWKSSQRLGVGVAVSADGREVYMVTNYYPAGNIVNHGYFEGNVAPVKY